MAKFYGTVGFIVNKETEPGSGVWAEQVINRKYYGDLLRNNKRWDSSENRNDDININNEVSILADPYANENFHMIRFVEFMGAKWKVTSVEVQFPRLILTIGGVYNGKSS